MKDKEAEAPAAAVRKAAMKSPRTTCWLTPYPDSLDELNDRADGCVAWRSGTF
ncbi:hypothetical protein LIP_0290 [Limnochorda pilosa]|uniref:Uncharacterized protein n=1 Tax=Limnochorda pilosa TaxID=1555112 RepID=A0A0K2SGK2_LIMPI|nr:hypothetical protein LIP_0290 [Limnochorda pilosa]